MSIDKNEKQHVHILDWMRGIAALLVCAGHLRNAMLVDWGDAHDHNFIQAILYGITGLGHQSVIVFFVLSGYLVGGSVISGGQKFRWSDYLVARLCRLWVVLVPCLLITLVIDSFTKQIANDVLTGAYAQKWHSAPSAGSYSASWITLLGNIAFVQTIFVPVFGTNGPLWSLANEFWYYIMFPLAWLSIGMAGRGVVQRLGGSFALFVILALLPVEIRLGFAVWALGALISYANRKIQLKMHPWIMWALSSAGLALGIAFSKWSASRMWSLPLGDWALGLAVSAFLLCALQVGSSPNGWLSGLANTLSRRLSDVSFTLYLSHFPMVLLISAYSFHDASLQPTAAVWVAFWGILLALLVAAFALWWLFERNTQTVRRLAMAFIQK